jgi:hypothetical protein
MGEIFLGKDIDDGDGGKVLHANLNCRLLKHLQTA